MLNIEDYREHYNKYFQEFNRLAVGEYAGLSYGSDKPNPTASSLESIIAYANYILNSGAKIELLNAGSGCSSWMFRKIFENRIIFCVDPNIHYNDFIKKICVENGIWAENFRSSSLSVIRLESFPYVYYDYGDIERLPYLGSAIDVATKSIYVDDVDNRPECKMYREIVIKLCERKGYKWFDVPESKDEHGRSGIIIEK